MAYNENIANRIREALSNIPKVEEKRMFGGLVFMVDNKKCMTIRGDNIMCRIDPAIHDEVILSKDCSAATMKGREFKGFIRLNEDNIKNKKDFDYWIGLALEYNKIAKASKK